jgi:Tol biopolymer transport system component
MKLFREVIVSGLIAALLAGGSFEAQTASAARPTSRGATYWILFGSDRDGANRSYSIRPDGSRLTPLLPKDRTHLLQSVSADGRLVAYADGFVSGAGGKSLRRVVKGYSTTLSRDGRMLAWLADDGLWVGETSGRHRRRLAKGRYIFDPSFSPTATAITYSAFVGDEEYVFVQPLGGRRRRLARGKSPKWSPDGRWLGYAGSISGSGTLSVMRPNGAQKHAVARDAYHFSWSPSGKELAYAGGSTFGVVGVAGRTARKLSTRGLQAAYPIWAPDGRRLFVTLGDQLWSVGRDGRGLRRLTSAGVNIAVGWTRLSPILPRAKPLPPTERVADARTVITRGPVTDLSADGTRAVFVTSSPIDCDHAAVWTPAAKAIARFVFPRLCLPTSTGSGIYDLELAGTRTAWVFYGGGNTWEFALMSATLRQRQPVSLSDNSADAGERWPYQVRGDGDVLVFNDGERLVRVGTGHERCQEKSAGSSICTTIRRGVHSAPIEAVSGSLIAIKEPTAVAVVDVRGELVRLFPFTASAARLDGDDLVVSRGDKLERYSVTTGAFEASQPLPGDYTLADVDGGIAVLRRPNAVRLVRLDDGHSLTIERRGPMFGDLEAPGLYYSYAVGKAGRVALLPRAEVVRRLS